MKVAAKPGVESEEPIDTQRGQKKRHRQSQRVDSKKQYSFKNSLFRASQDQNGGENGPNAGSPAKGKGEANCERAQGAGTALDVVHALVRVECLDLQESHQVQAKHNHD